MIPSNPFKASSAASRAGRKRSRKSRKQSNHGWSESESLHRTEQMLQQTNCIELHASETQLATNSIALRDHTAKPSLGHPRHAEQKWTRILGLALEIHTYARNTHRSVLALLNQLLHSRRILSSFLGPLAYKVSTLNLIIATSICQPINCPHLPRSQSGQKEADLAPSPLDIYIQSSRSFHDPLPAFCRIQACFNSNSSTVGAGPSTMPWQPQWNWQGSNIALAGQFWLSSQPTPEESDKHGLENETVLNSCMTSRDMCLNCAKIVWQCLVTAEIQGAAIVQTQA